MPEEMNKENVLKFVKYILHTNEVFGGQTSGLLNIVLDQDFSKIDDEKIKNAKDFIQYLNVFIAAKEELDYSNEQKLKQANA